MMKRIKNFIKIVVRIISQLRRIDYNNIELVITSYKGVIYYGKDKYGKDARGSVEFLPPGSSSIVWSVEDFEEAAKQNCSNWEDIYDTALFSHALYVMIYRHDSTEGINWDTVKEYLEMYCKKVRK